MISQNIDELLDQGSQVIVASMAFGTGSMDEEMMIHGCAEKRSVPVTTASDITKPYGLTRYTRTAVINAPILPKMMMTVNVAKLSIHAVGTTVPLVIMRGDGGVMEINEMCRRPIPTAPSGPAAPAMGSLIYLHAPNAIYFEVGGITASIGVIKSGHPGVDYVQVGGHDTYTSSLDVHIPDCAGGSMVRISDKAVVNVGPRPTHIAGCEYACSTPEEEIEDPQIEMVSPKPGDPNDYVTIRLENGEYIRFTNICATNVLGLIEEQYLVHGNANAAHKVMQPTADELSITMEELTTQILGKDSEKVNACINALAEEYQLDHESMKLVGCGGGTVSLVPYCAGKMGLQYSIPEDVEVVSSTGVVLSMVHDVVERVIPDPFQDDTRELKKEAADMTVSFDASSDTVEVRIEIDSRTGKVTAIVTGSTGAKTADLLEEYGEAEACELTTQDFGPKVNQIALAEVIDKFYVYQGLYDGRHPLRVVDKRGFIKVQCSNGSVVKCKIAGYKEVVEQMWKDEAAFKTDTITGPDLFVYVGPRVGGYSAVDLDQIYLLMDLDLDDKRSDENILIAASVTEIQLITNREEFQKALKPIADGLFGKQGTERYERLHFPPWPLDQTLGGLAVIEPVEWFRYVSLREPLNGKFTDEQRRSWIEQALVCEQEYTRRVIEKYRSSDPEVIAKVMGTKVSYPTYSEKTDRVLFTECRVPDTICIYMGATKKAKKFLERPEIKEILVEGLDINRLLLAHELLHNVEERYKHEIYTKTEKTRLWLLSPAHNDSTIVTLGEIVAMVFAKEIMGIPYALHVIDAFLVYGYSPKEASGLYEGMMEFAGLEPYAPEQAPDSN